jgi:Putative GTP-binding controlling metal-binding
MWLILKPQWGENCYQMQSWKNAENALNHTFDSGARPGADVAASTVAQAVRHTAAQEAPRASGTLEAHYAPNATLRLMDAKALQTALDLLGADAAHIAVYARAILASKSAQVIRRRMPDDALATAQQLFAVLRAFDAQGAKLIWVEMPPSDAAWDGVRDRLQRAAAAF